MIFSINQRRVNSFHSGRIIYVGTTAVCVILWLGTMLFALANGIPMETSISELLSISSEIHLSLLDVHGFSWLAATTLVLLSMAFE